ncbi:MAG TPA: MlaD family protein, partial [Nocardioides sp.]|nr:MlaD family protein [Nocardioides sp.]
MTRRFRAVVVLLAAVLMLGGCGFDVYSLPLPGGADVGSKPITVTAEFRDVLDLVPQSAVKVNDVTVGKVTKVERKGYLAEVTMDIRNDTDLPANATANIRQT